MDVNDIDKGPFVMTNENRKIYFMILVVSIIFEIVYLNYLYLTIDESLFKGDLWNDFLLYAPVIFFLFTAILGFINYYKRGIKYYENGILLYRNPLKKEFIKYADIEYIMIPERTTKQYLWYGDLTPKIKIKYQDKLVRIWQISKNALKFLESKCEIKTFQGKYQLETDVSRSEQKG
ncbi:MAG: hypothetical protein JSW00_04425 [Thermoplasmata archaeon]|nr:MAG: hypothetical protein JSW00_04425 [Thermoplasmata archaeon]